MRSRLMSLLGSALFLVIAPGTVAGLVPWWITGWTPGEAPASAVPLRLIGLPLIGAGLPALLDAFFRFAWIGRGSPAPVMPTETLIVSGLHRYVRNPMYLAVLTLIVGQAVWFWRVELVYYAIAVAILFHLFVRVYEEPTLQRQFGPSYARYCRHVRRWLPRLHAWDPDFTSSTERP